MTAGSSQTYEGYSFWLDDVPGGITPRPPLEGPTDVDVAVVGAGYTGLWAAYYLIKADPRLRVAVLEKDVAGFGASGRSGGWVSPMFATPLATLAREHGRDAAIAMQLAMFDTVDEIGRVTAAEAIDAGYSKDGMLWLSTSPAQTPRLRAVMEEQSSYGFADDWAWITRRDALARIRVEGCLGGIQSSRYASVQPARLARGLADVVERMGVHIYEGTPALKVEPGGVDTPVGRVRADAVILATEAYTAQLPGYGRDVVAIYDLMIATEPLSPKVWDEIGWRRREVLSDGAYLFVYCQRTQEGRIAIGGTTGPYHLGSRISPRFERSPVVHERIHTALKRLFPAVSDAEVTHRWGGVLAASRDWHSSVTFDPATGMGWAGNYVGDGVATSNLAGRTLTDLLLRRDSDLVRLPWVNHHSKKWEPEPLRWLAANGMQAVMNHADAVETGKGRPVRWKRLLDKVEEIVGW
jgi:glycine/D-amino acid oxidase-like deaminating enzyme